MESSNHVHSRDDAVGSRRVNPLFERWTTSPVRRCMSGSKVFAAVACALLALGSWGRAHAVDYTWDCNTTSGIDPCGGNLSDQRFTTNGTTLVTWPGGTNTMVFAGGAEDTGTWDISSGGTYSIGGLTASQKRYTLAGSGTLQLASSPAIFLIDSSISISMKLGGSGGIDKRGGGALTLSGNNVYTGATTVSLGTLKIGHDSALGSTDGATTVASSGTLDVNGRLLGNEQLYLDGGTLVNRGADKDVTFRRLTVRANSTLGGTGMFGIRKGDDANSLLRVDAAAILTKVDTNTFLLGGLPVVVEGRFDVRAGELRVWGGTTFSGAGDFLFAAGSWFSLYPNPDGLNVANDVRAEGMSINVFGDSLAGRVDFSKTLTLDGATTTVNCLSKAIVSGNLAGGGRLRKWGDSSLVLAGDNGSYQGTLDIVTGTLQIGNGGGTGIVASDSILLGTSLVFDHTGTKTFAGSITGDGRLTRRGSGTDIFTGNLTHKGGTTIAAGTLQVGAGGSTGRISGTIVDSGTLAFDYSSGTMVYFSDSIRGPGSLVKRGAGVLVLGGRSGYTGTTTVSGGKLVVAGTLGGTAVTVGDGASLGGNGSISGNVSIASGGVLDPGEHDSTGILRTGALTIASGGKASFRIGTDDNRVDVDGNLAISGRINLQAGTGIKAGTYTLFTGNGTISIDGATIDSVPTGYRATLGTTSGSVTVMLEFVGASLHWDCSAESGLQPCNGSWTEPKFSTDSVHLVNWPGAGNRAIFAGADGNYRIENKGNRVVDSLIFRSSGYRLVGDTILLAKGIRVEAGKVDTLDSTVVSGPGIVLDGGGTLVLRNSTAQMFGSLKVARGTFVATRSSNAPSGNKLGTGNVIVASGAALVLDSLVHVDRYANPLRIAGTGFGKGALHFSNNRLGATYEGAIALDGDATIGSLTASRPEGRFATISGGIGGDHDLTLSAFKGVLRVTGAITVGGGLTTNGPDTVVLAGSNTYAGNTVVASGTLQLGADGAIPDGLGKGLLDVAGVFDLNGFDEGVNGLGGAGRIDMGKAGDTSTLLLGADGSASEFAGSLSNTGGVLNVVKLGSGTLTFSGNSTYSGTTRVNGGTLIVDGGCDSTTITVNTGATLGGTGSVGAVVGSSGIMRPGHVDGIGVLKAARADLSGGDASSLFVRASGTVAAGTDYDRLDLSGPLVLGGGSVLTVDLAGFSGDGTVEGVVRASSVSGTFSSVNVIHAGGHTVKLRYAETSVDLLVTTVPYAATLDTTVPPGTDSVFLTVGNGVVVIVPPREDSRHLHISIEDSVLGHGIAGADTAIVLDAGASAAKPVVIRAPVDLVPSARRIAGEVPSVYRLDSLGKVRIVPSRLRVDSTLEFVAVHDGAHWLGYDTIPPEVGAVIERDSLRSGDSTRISWSMRDNVADAEAWMCVLRAGSSGPECARLAQGDSLEDARFLSQPSIPFGAAVRIEGRDARTVSRTAWRDVVVAIDTLRASEAREEDRYELVSFPYGTERSRAHDLFASQWGTDDPSRWRAYVYDSTRYEEIVSGDTTTSLGRAFWVRSRKVPRAPWVAGGWTWPVSVPVPVALHPGWNMVGNPLGFDVDWKRALELSGIDTMGLSGPYGFDGARQEWLLPEASSTLRAWKGVALLNSTGSTLSLRIPSVAPGLLAARAARRNISLRIALRSGQASRSSARIWMGIDPACAGACRSHPMPPSPGTALDLHLPPPRGSRIGGAFLADVRGATDSVQKWTVHVGGLAPDVPLVLETDRSGTDTAMPVLVRDDKADRWYRLGARMEFAVGGESKRTFTFMAGGDASLLRRGGTFAVQARGRTVRWCIPPEMGRTRVRIEIRDLSGRRTELLLDETMDAGSYARDMGGIVASSPRLVVLRAGGRVQSALLVRLR